MANLDLLTLMMSIQAVQSEITKYEHLLTSETLRDTAEIQSLVFSYEKAAQSLKEAYLKEWSEGSNLPKYEKLVSQK